MHVTFPHLPAWQGVQFYLGGQSLDTQESINGTPVVVPTMRGRWMATVSMVLHDEGSTLQWLAFLAQMQGRIGTTDVPVLSRYRPKTGRTGPGGGLQPSFGSVATLAEAQFMEHSGFGQTSIGRVVLNGAIALRETQIEARFNGNTTGLRPGHYFSMDGDLHRALQVYESRKTEGGSPRYAVRMEPPARKAHPGETQMEVDNPTCRMRFVTETEGLFDQSLSLLPTVTCNFIEAN